MTQGARTTAGADGTGARPGVPLEPSTEELRAMGRVAVDLAAGFVAGLDTAPAAPLGGGDDLVAAALRPPPEGPGELEPLLREVEAAARLAIDTAGPGYMAYVPGGGLVTAALADLVADALNRFTGLAAFAPALVALEESVLRWMADTFGLPPGSGGVTTTGGSMAMLTGLVAARQDRLGEDLAGGTLYVSAHTHRSVAKAARIAGFPAHAIRAVPTTPDLRMDPEAAAALVAADRHAGRRPFLLVATAGTTDTGTVDPLPELADLARREGLWLHVDAAYGGFFQLTERGRTRLAGVEQADSLVLDPHKGMFLPYGTGVLLARDAGTLRAAFAADGAYLQDARNGGLVLPDYGNLGPELSRDFRGLRLWLPLHLHGVDAFRAALDEKLDLAAEAHRALSEVPELEVPWAPDLSVVVLQPRRRPGWTGEDADRAGAQLLDRVNATQRVHLSSTRIGGRYTLRICILSHRTHRPHVAAAVDALRTAARDLLAQGAP